MAEFEPRKRRRPAKSCEQCRQRKIRCDRNVPCGPCTRARSSMDCSYRHSAPSPSPIARYSPLHASPRPLHFAVGLGNGGTASHIGSGSGSTEQQEGALSQLGSVVRDLQLRLQRLEERLSDGAARLPASDSTLEQALRELCTKVQNLEQRLASSDSDSTQGHEELSIAATSPRLHMSTRKMKLFGPTHYVHMMDKLQLVGSLETKGPQPVCPELRAELTSQIREIRDLRRSVKIEQTPRLNDPVSDLRRTIPARSVCDELVECYLRTFEGIYRIEHLPSFRREYQQFWDQPQASATSFLIKLVLILGIGTTFHPQRGKAGKDYDPPLLQAWIYAAQWWLTGPTEKSTFNLDGLQIFCLLLLARQLGPPGPSPWLSAASLLQIATAMGLHRDSALFPSLSPFQSEMRARLWATVLELTLQSSLESASPLAIPFSDANPPSNLNDSSIDHDVKHIPPPQPISSHTDSSLQLLLHQSFSLRAETIQLIHRPHRIPYQKALTLATALRTACHTLTAFFTTTTTTTTTTTPKTLPSPSPFHYTHLLTTLTRYILHLHLPFARASPTHPEYHFSRKLCLDAALTIASTITITPSQQPPDFLSLTTTAHGPLRGPLNLDIISTLAHELLTQIVECPPPPPSSPNPNIFPPAHNPLTNLHKSTRAQILHVLETVQSQSLHVLQLGTPALKRYVIVSALVAQGL
ncbi:hypothetical protein BO71DRAFT_489331 [Aspergillus ellipticus CBS 707.79]|uniref:Zn(2)-C6 fungal-type domain-containing protein n=1 Tax=Aspergillus ellipticus CBS 707.79 TaxID=1448320 RepID=A0A319CZG5_9EURO|nr:hypothetical protein BO71DRAFT_489331 [Aspergillus ellipticus CBS 707.79]